MMDRRDRFMRLCIELGYKAKEQGDPPVGSLLVHNGNIIGKGIESGRSSGDVTRHAEILAIQDALSLGHQEKLSSSILYTTHEPCWMCSYPIRHYQIAMVVFGLSVPEVGGYSSSFKILQTESVASWPSVPVIESGVLEEECRSLHE